MYIDNMYIDNRSNMYAAHQPQCSRCCMKSPLHGGRSIWLHAAGPAGTAAQPAARAGSTTVLFTVCCACACRGRGAPWQLPPPPPRRAPLPAVRLVPLPAAARACGPGRAPAPAARKALWSARAAGKAQCSRGNAFRDTCAAATCSCCRPTCLPHTSSAVSTSCAVGARCPSGDLRLAPTPPLSSKPCTTCRQHRSGHGCVRGQIVACAAPGEMGSMAGQCRSKVARAHVDPH